MEMSDLPVFEFNHQDSATVRALADQYVAFYKEGNLDAAADMLYTVHGDSIMPLTDEQREGFKTALSVLPNFGCEIKDVEMLSDRDNRVRILLKVAEDGDFETEKGTINFFLNPILVEGQWYLSLLDKYAEGVGLYH